MEYHNQRPTNVHTRSYPHQEQWFRKVTKRKPEQQAYLCNIAGP